MKKKLIIPKFRNQDEESDWWASLNLAEYFDRSDFRAFELRAFLTEHQAPASKRITIRVPAAWIAKAKAKAAELDMPYQTLLKQFIHNGLNAK